MDLRDCRLVVVRPSEQTSTQSIVIIDPSHISSRSERSMYGGINRSSRARPYGEQSADVATVGRRVLVPLPGYQSLSISVRER